MAIAFFTFATLPECGPLCPLYAPGSKLGGKVGATGWERGGCAYLSHFFLSVLNPWRWLTRAVLFPLYYHWVGVWNFLKICLRLVLSHTFWPQNCCGRYMWLYCIYVYKNIVRYAAENTLPVWQVAKSGCLKKISCISHIPRPANSVPNSINITQGREDVITKQLKTQHIYHAQHIFQTPLSRTYHAPFKLSVQHITVHGWSQEFSESLSSTKGSCMSDSKPVVGHGKKVFSQ